MHLKLMKVFALSLAVLLVGGCAKSNDPAGAKAKLDPKNPVSVEIWHYYNGPQKVAFDNLVTEFNESVGQDKGIVIEAFSQGNVNDLFRKVHEAADKKVGAGEVPDVFAAYSDTVYDLDAEGMVASLDQYLTEEEIGQYVDGYIKEGRFDQSGNLKIFPIAKSTEIFMMNKTDWDKFAAATGASVDTLATVEGVTATAKEYYEWTDSLTPDVANDGKAFYGRDAMANYMVSGYYQTAGKPLFDHKDGKTSFEPDRQALRQLWDHYYVPYVNGWFGAYGKFRSDDAKTGDIIALIGSTSGALYFPDEVTVSDTESYPIEVLALPTPLFEGAKPSSIQQGAGMVVTKSDPSTELAAVTFLRWFTEADRNIAFAVDSSYMPVKKEANDIDRILAAQTGKPLADKVKQTLTHAIEMVGTREMFAEQAFNGSADARNVLEVSMSDQAAADRAAVLEAIAGGASVEEALAPYLTDEAYNNWCDTLIEQVRETLA